MSRWTTLILIVVALCACKHQNQAPPASVDDGPGQVSTPSPNKKDAAQANEDMDGGAEAPDAGGPLLAAECQRVDEMHIVSEDTPAGQFLNAISSPADLGVTRVKTTWEKDCLNPVLRLEMSDGFCPNGSGHALVFRFPVKAIQDGSIRGGLNTISSTAGGSDASIADAVDVRYTRPTRLQPSGTWGTCDGANGTLDIVGELNLNAMTVLQGRFDLELTDCTGNKKAVQTVSGTYSGKIRRTLMQVCPGFR